MAYISSNENRLYVAAEQNYGQVSGIDSRNRIPAVKLETKQQLERPARKDKTGSRTFPGVPWGLKRKTTYELTTYLTGWTQQGIEPGYGPLFRAGLGAGPVFFNGGMAGSGSSGRTLNFTAAHGLSAGQAVTFGGELRFVCSIINATSVELNAPFTLTPPANAPVGGTVTYQPETELGSVSVFDYWSPSSAVQRILCGAAVDKLRVRVNADYHEFEFSGPAKDLIDSLSFAAGQGELSSFPAEPVLDQFDYSIVPGHLGQAWLGNTPDQFLTLTGAELLLDNDVEMRILEFGCQAQAPQCISPGVRAVSVNLDLYERNDAATQALYQAARQYSPMAVMFQLGQQSGQLFGAYLTGVLPEVPEFDDSDRRLQWRFVNCRAQGTQNDEIYIAFG
jgi:hypothetical protein